MAKKNTNNTELINRFASSARRNEKFIRVNILVVCEGEQTEPSYFESFPTNLKGITVKLDCIPGNKKNQPSQILDRAINLAKQSKINYDQIWIVFDKDDTLDEDFNKTILEANKKKIKIAWSNEAFELWYVLHFQECTSSLSRKDYKKLIEKGLNKNNKGKKIEYSKNRKDMFDLLSKYGDRDAALSRAKKCNNQFDCQHYSKHNPATIVCFLVETMLGESEEFNKFIKEKINREHR